MANGDIFTGNVFSVGTNPTKGLNVQNYMKAMGSENDDFVEFDPVEPLNQTLQTGIDAEGAYYNSLQNLNQFGMAMAGKGINVYRPDARNPDSVKASQEFNRMLKGVQMQGGALRTGHEISKLYAQERLKNNVVGPGLIDKNSAFTGASTSAELDNLINIHPYVAPIKDAVNQINKLARTYNSDMEADDANLKINSMRDNIGGFLDTLIEGGIPKPMAELIIHNAQNGIGKATFDPLKEKQINAQIEQGQRRVDLQSLKTSSQLAKDKLTMEKKQQEIDAGPKGQKQLDIEGRSSLIDDIDEGNIQKMIGGKIGGNTILKARVDDDGSLKLTLSGDASPVTIPRTTSKEKINDVLNTFAGAQKITPEQYREYVANKGAPAKETTTLSKNYREATDNLSVAFPSYSGLSGKQKSALYKFVVDKNGGKMPAKNQFEYIINTYK